MNLRKAKKLKVGDTVLLTWPQAISAEIVAVKPDPDPRIKLLFDLDIKGRIRHNLNYLHIGCKL